VSAELKDLKSNVTELSQFLKIAETISEKGYIDRRKY
jgi:hypothetical protein